MSFVSMLQLVKYLIYRNICQMSSCNGINHNNLLLNRHWLILRLFQYLLDTFTLCQVLQCIRIQIGTEL